MGNLPRLLRGLARRSGFAHSAGMADGYIVEVTNPDASDSEPTKQIWYAHIHDRNQAIKAVRKASGAKRHAAVDIVRPEKHIMLLERLGILEGEVWLS